MHRVTRKIRGVFGSALVWGLAFLPIALALGIYRAVTLELDIPTPPSFRIKAFLVVAASYTLWGAFSGGVFGLVLALVERRRSIDDLSTWRVAIWGAFGAISLPLLFTLLLFISEGEVFFGWPATILLAVSSALGATCAAGTLAVARRRGIPPASSAGSLTSA